MELNPFDWAGTPFLMLYGILLVLTIGLGVLIPAWLRPEGHSRRVDHPEELALLAGGRPRHAEAIAASLLARGALDMLDKNRMKPGRGELAQTSAERAVVNQVAPITFRDIRKAAELDAEAMEDQLERDGLRMDSGTAWQMRFFQVMPYVALIGFGLVKYEIGIARDRPVGFLTVLLILTAVLAIWRFFKVDRRTRAGIAAVNSARKQSDRLRRAPTGQETGQAVALYGTAVLAGTPIAAFHTMRNSQSGDGGSGGNSDSGGDGGGCGGGCGGCGG